MSQSAEERYWVGFDLGGTKMLAAVFDDKFKLLARRRKKTKGNEGVEAGVGRIVEAIQGALDEAGVEPAQLAGIGIGCAGPIDLQNGAILDAVNLGWKNVPLRKTLEAKFGCPVVVSNDVDAGLYGEYRFGAGRDGRCLLGLFPGTGIGGACVYEGRIVRGKRVSAMEIGHVQVVFNGRLCGCGRYGCLETEGSRLAIAAAVAMAAYRGEAPYIKEKAGTDLSEIRSGVLADAIKAGDVAVEKIVLRAAGFMGIAVANFVNLLSPDLVVLGGGLVEALPKLIVPAVQAAANQAVMPSFVGTFHVVPAKLADDATILGAAAWAAKEIAGS